MECDVMSCCPYSQWSQNNFTSLQSSVSTYFIPSLILNIFFLSILSLYVLWHRSLGNALHLLFTGALHSPRAAHTLTQSHTHSRSPIHRRWIIYLRVIWDQKYVHVRRVLSNVQREVCHVIGWSWLRGWCNTPSQCDEVSSGHNGRRDPSVRAHSLDRERVWSKPEHYNSLLNKTGKVK